MSLQLIRSCELDSDTDNEIVLILTRLRHYCDEAGLDYYSLADRSYDLYRVEQDEATRPVDKH